MDNDGASINDFGDDGVYTGAPAPFVA